MKKRVVSILLSVALCVGPVVQAGAAEFTDQSGITIEAADTVETPVVPLETQNPVETEAPVVTPAESIVQEPEITSAEENTDVVVTPEAPAENITVPETPVEDIFSSGTEAQETEQQTSLGISEIEGGYAVPVSAWEATADGYWKLRKGTDELTGEAVYFTLADGMIRICTTEGETVLSDGYYQFDGNGLMMTGYQKIVRAVMALSLDSEEDEYAFFTDQESTVLNAGVPEGTAATPWNSNLGRSINNSWLWVSDAFHYYGADGMEVSVAQLKKESGFKGYFSINGDYYYLDDNGRPYVGEKTITAAEGTMTGDYLFLPAAENGIPGKMCVEGWHKDTAEKGDRYRYFGTPKDARPGARLYAEVTIADLTAQTGEKDAKYIVDAEGYLLKAQQVTINGKYYGTDKDGKLLADKLCKFGSSRYYFTSDGTRAAYKNGWYRCAGEQNRYYYFGSTAGMVEERTSWQKIDGKWFYFGTAGDHLVNILLSNGRYFDENGAMAEGMYKSSVSTASGAYRMVKGETYYFLPSTASAKNGAMYKSKWIRYNNNWYYAGSNGVLFHDVLLNNGRLFNSDGTMASGFVTATENIKGQSGVYNMKKGERYYFTPSTDKKAYGAMYRSKWLRYNNNWYYAGSNGALFHDVLLNNGRLFNSDGTMASGFVTATENIKGQSGKYNMKKGERYYFTPSTNAKAYGAMYRSKWLRYDNNWYYAGSNGALFHDVLLNNGRLFYKDGTMASGFVTAMENVVGQGGKYKMYKGYTYYFAPSTNKKAYGAMYRSKWLRNNNKWYYTGSNGIVFKNMMLDNGRYFHEDGTMAEGIETAMDGKTYFFRYSTSTKASGYMYKNTLISYKGKWYGAGADGQLKKNEWAKYNNNLYYFQSDYTMKTNGFAKKDDGTNVYLDSTGKICTGWVIVSNSQNLVRYINPDGNGYCKNESKWIDGKLYYFDANGYRINDLTSKYKGPYYLQLNRHAGLLTVYADAKRTIPVKSIRVSVGLAGTPTPVGDYTMHRADKWQALMGPSWGQYGTHVVGGIYVHSIACSYRNPYNLAVSAYNKLGVPASHGCIRAAVKDAKWVYNNCNGAKINIGDYAFDANNEALRGPLGRPALVPYTGNSADPTDDFTNPW